MATKQASSEGSSISLASLLSKKPVQSTFHCWIVGDTPLICHAWSEKAKQAMLQKQVKATRPGREAKDPEQLFADSVYHMGKNGFGFPVTGIKKAIVGSAHKDKGVARTGAKRDLFLDAEMVSVRPALAGARCDVPLVRIYGSEPEMREDMVRVGTGLNKSADLAYRAQFTTWAIKLTGKLSSTMNADQLMFLVSEAGLATGIGDWRNEKDGVFGAFHLAELEEQEEWEAFRTGTGPLPVPPSYRMLEAAE